VDAADITVAYVLRNLVLVGEFEGVDGLNSLSAREDRDLARRAKATWLLSLPGDEVSDALRASLARLGFILRKISDVLTPRGSYRMHRVYALINLSESGISSRGLGGP
jgi:hypothetical protein